MLSQMYSALLILPWAWEGATFFEVNQSLSWIFTSLRWALLLSIFCCCCCLSSRISCSHLTWYFSPRPDTSFLWLPSWLLLYRHPAEEFPLHAPLPPLGICREWTCHFLQRLENWVFLYTYPWGVWSSNFQTWSGSAKSSSLLVC